MKKLFFILPFLIMLSSCATSKLQTSIERCNKLIDDQRNLILEQKERIDRLETLVNFHLTMLYKNSIPSNNENNSLESSNNIINNSSNLVNVANNRCKAITQNGTQCSRNSKEDSDYCSQHSKIYSSGSQNESSNTEIATSNSTKKNYSGSRKILTGPRGGKYYINSNGNKTYIRK